MAQKHRLLRKAKDPQQTRLFDHIYPLQVKLDDLAENSSFFSRFFLSSQRLQAIDLSDRLEKIENVLGWYKLTREVLTKPYDTQIKTFFKMAFVDHELGAGYIKKEASRINNRRIEAVSRHHGPPTGAFGVLGFIMQKPRTEHELYEQKYHELATRYDNLLLQQDKLSESLELTKPKFM